MNRRDLTLLACLSFGTACPADPDPQTTAAATDPATDGADATDPGDASTTDDEPTTGDPGDPVDPPSEPSARCEQTRPGARLLRRLTRDELQRSLVDIFPEVTNEWGGVDLGADPVSPLGFTNDAATLVVADQAAQEILNTAEEIASLITAPAALSQLLPCAVQTPDSTCAAEFVDRFGPRLFRRPLLAAERDELLAHFAALAAQADFPVALEWTAVAMLQSPHFVYRSELGAPDGGGHVLTAHEQATALAYTFGGTTPTPELVARAEAGMLASPAARVAEAEALLAGPGGREVLRRFFAEWIRYPLALGRVKTGVPGFDALAEAMVAETRRFIDAVVLEQGGDVRALLTAPFTVPGPALAAFYGYGAPAGDADPVERPDEWGVGLLAQGSLLAGHAQADASSPTQRGVLVYERLLCGPHLTPPANIPPIDPPAPGASTTRERYELGHAADPACNGCHQFFDPIGFGFEHFDEVGRYRADEHGLVIDATGHAKSPKNGSVLLEFDGLGELAERAADRPEVTDCVSGLMVAYAFGSDEGCLAEDPRTALQAGELGLRAFYAELAASPRFERRDE